MAAVVVFAAVAALTATAIAPRLLPCGVRVESREMEDTQDDALLEFLRGEARLHQRVISKVRGCLHDEDVYDVEALRGHCTGLVV